MTSYEANLEHPLYLEAIQNAIALRSFDAKIKRKTKSVSETKMLRNCLTAYWVNKEMVEYFSNGKVRSSSTEMVRRGIKLLRDLDIVLPNPFPKVYRI
jgi:hypothetical protein